MRDRTEAFGSFHPAATFTFFVCAIALGVVVQHPVFLAVDVLAAVAACLCLVGPRGWRPVCGAAVVLVAVAAVNPLFNTQGETVLLTWLGGRPYTAEALAFGAATGAMIAGMLLWFGCFNAVMTSDKLAYLFGKAAPTISLVFTMVLRLVPSYERKAAQLASARACVGKGAATGGARDRIADASALLSVLAGWAFENAVVTADSMRSRGFGTGARTPYALFRFGGRDAALLAVVVACAATTVACLVRGAAAVAYVPSIEVAGATPAFWAGIAAYAALLAVPTFLSVREKVVWRISLSRI